MNPGYEDVFKVMAVKKETEKKTYGVEELVLQCFSPFLMEVRSQYEPSELVNSSVVSTESQTSPLTSSSFWINR